MSIEAIRAFERHSKATRSTYTVGHQLASFAERQTDLAWPTTDQLVDACRLSKRQVLRSLQWLEQAGEIVRQPPAPGRRRVFRLTPATPAQEPLFDLGKSPTLASGRCHPVTLAGASLSPSQGATLPPKGASRRRALKDVSPPSNNTPPAPRAGGSAPDLLGALDHHLIAGRLAPLPRRRRDRSARHTALLEPCPNGQTDADALAEWTRIGAAVRDRLGQDLWQAWLAPAHAHRLDAGTLVLALAPETLDWVHQRYGDLIASSSPRPVALVGCQALGAT